ncbi:hypothetical protein V1477_020015 [Vespula maculifrons]|uniref:Uncharacterized protein n=1 Tax=Vespula maculifrons TaxID=7453 RepID=A0ABD2AMY1_VESMC
MTRTRTTTTTTKTTTTTTTRTINGLRVPVEDQAIPTPNTLIAPKNSKVDSGQTGKSRRTCLEHKVHRPSDIKHWPSLRKARKAKKKRGPYR